MSEIHRIIEVTDLDDYRLLIKDKTCVVKFTANWCGPCKKIAPTFKELALSCHDISFLEVDVDRADDISDLEKVQGIPMFLFFYQGEKLPSLTFSGANVSALKNNCKLLVQKISDANMPIVDSSDSDDSYDSNNSDELEETSESDKSDKSPTVDKSDKSPPPDKSDKSDKSPSVNKLSDDK